MDLIEERTIALAGVLQACQQVQSLAREGSASQGEMASSLKSILVLDAVSTPAVFGGLSGVRAGLRMIAEGVFTSTQGKDIELLRYAVSILQLQAQLYRDAEKFDQFANDVERLSSFSEDTMLEACSDVYQKHISSMRPQIIVQGESGHLQNPDIPPKIRALLLAAFRAAVLWQQKKGGRFRLLWERTRMQNAARQLLTQGSAD
ncbi:high frequency lysogenization protein HflD [Arenicella chitinivorans]|uniref:High frequency lysogenization protein HflD n=1 Tax=Arenicella chitinivorans TaxID=1329800 RepID=A0A918VLQ6_9GAMM|nr:DUF489 family protein [Arenicella chitinivorans]GHA08635.1 high frequency lysogenization protein HflD [Arenicella chitinivorans]